MIDAYSLNERSKPRVGVQPVEKRVLREEIDQRRSILQGAFQKQKRRLGIRERSIDQGDVVSGDISLLGQLQHPIQFRQRFFASTRQCECLRAEGIAAGCLERAPVDFLERASYSPLPRRSRIKTLRALSRALVERENLLFEAESTRR